MCKIKFKRNWYGMFEKNKKNGRRKDDDMIARHEMFTKNALKGVAELRKYLDPSSTNSGQIFGAEHVASPRDYVISGMVNEVEKAAISSMQTSSFILDSHASDLKSTDKEKAAVAKMIEEMPGLDAAIFQSRIDEMTLWERKLTEELVDLVGFRRSRKGEYYRHYAMLRERERLVKIASDFREYHASENKNIKYQIDEIEGRIDKHVTSLDQSKCWYVKSTDQTKKSRFEIADYRARLNSVLPWMSGNQKIMIGTSYGEYSVQSGNLHPGQVKIKDEIATMKALDNHFMRVTMLAMEVIFAAMDARGMYNTRGWLGAIAKATKKNDYPATLLARMTKPNIEKGDFVIAYGDLAEVTKVNRSKYGYRGFRVRYLEKPPIPEIKEDEMPARYVKLLTKRKPIFDGVVQLFATEGIQSSTRRINSGIRKQVLEMWTEMGYKEMAFGRQEEGRKKLKQYVNKMTAGDR